MANAAPDAPPRARAWAQMLQEQSEPDTVLHGVGANCEWLCDHVDDWEDGDVDPGDLPHFDDAVQSLFIYAVMFGTLWELSHPSIFAVLDDEDRLIALYGHESNAADRAADGDLWRVQRMSVADGDKDPEDVLEMEAGDA